MGREPAAQVVEQRTHSHEVGMHHEPGHRHARGSRMDGVNRRAVGPPDREALDLRLMTPVSECSHGREP